MVGLKKTFKKVSYLGFPKLLLRKDGYQAIFHSLVRMARGLQAEPWDKYISVADEGRFLELG